MIIYNFILLVFISHIYSHTYTHTHTRTHTHTPYTRAHTHTHTHTHTCTHTHTHTHTHTKAHIQFLYRSYMSTRTSYDLLSWPTYIGFLIGLLFA